MLEPRFAASKVQRALAELGFVIEREPLVEIGQRVDLLARRGMSHTSSRLNTKYRSEGHSFWVPSRTASSKLRDWGKRAPGCKPLLAVWVERAKPNAAPEFEAYLGIMRPTSIGSSWMRRDGASGRLAAIRGKRKERHEKKSSD